MARLRAGILGNVRGKVSGVVGSQWKDKNYVREYVKPANPNTAAQQAQRSKMRLAVNFAKTLVGPIFNAYTDKFQKSMSGFNRFIKSNISEFVAPVDYSALVLSEGKLFGLTTLHAVYNTATGDCVCSFNSMLGNNGALDDQVYACVYHEPSGFWYFAPGEVDRSTNTITVDCLAGKTATDLHAYALCCKRVGGVVSMISDSKYDLAEAA